MVTAKDVEQDLKKPEYNFLRENEHLGDNIILLTLGGSKAYGTNVDTPEHTSDTDIRGIALNDRKEILLRQDFEQIIDTPTDTVVYSFNKIIKLLSECNPNTIEMLGAEPEQYICLSSIGKDMVINSDMFLSKRAVNTFGGYATAQLRRLQNALAHDNYSNSEKEQHILDTIRTSLYNLIARYIPFNNVNDERISSIIHAAEAENRINRLSKTMEIIQPKIDAYKKDCKTFNLYIDESSHPDKDTEIFCDMRFDHVPLRDLHGFVQELGSIVRDYDKLGKRNTKKDDMHLNKHAMHLIRLYLMAFDILEKQEIRTYRGKDLDLLMSIRNGEYQLPNGKFRSEFYEMVDEFEKRLTYDAQNTSLPDFPDYERIENLVMSTNKKIVLGTAKDMNLDDYIKANSRIR